MISTEVQNFPFFSLPPELQVEVFTFVLSEEGQLGSRLVCKQWLGVINEGVKKRWQSLVQNPPQGPIALEFAFNRIKNKFSIDGHYPENLNYLILFRALNEEWKAAGVAIPRGELKLSHSHHAALQAQLYQRLIDESLTKMWGKIWLSLLPYSFQLSTSRDIKKWMAHVHNEAICTSLLQMNLSDLGIRYLPFEVCAFTNLEELDLSQNHIDVLPDFVGDLKELQVLNLQDNDLQELPDSFPTWTHLRVVNLSVNPLNTRGLAQLEQWEKNVSAVINSKDPIENAN